MLEWDWKGSSQEDVHTDEIPEVSDDVVADFNEVIAKIARNSKNNAITVHNNAKRNPDRDKIDHYYVVPSTLQRRII